LLLAFLGVLDHDLGDALVHVAVVDIIERRAVLSADEGGHGRGQ
jgi:hypothetical protein